MSGLNGRSRGAEERQAQDKIRIQSTYMYHCNRKKMGVDVALLLKHRVNALMGVHVALRCVPCL
jgi:hypothetical protein